MKTHMEFLATSKHTPLQGLFNWTGHLSPHVRETPSDQTLLEIVDGLYRHIDLQSLIEALYSRLQTQYLLESIRFQMPGQNIQYGDIPGPTEYRGHSPLLFNLTFDSKKSGTLGLYRRSRFTKTEINSLNRLVEHLTGPLNNAISYEEACHAAYNDSLTGLYNRAALKNYFSSLSLTDNNFSGINAGNSAPSVLMVCDIDEFKSINDRYNHTIGDEVLRKFSQRLLDSTPNRDSVFRYGGDEFVIIHYKDHIQNSQQTAENIRRSIEKNTICVNGFSIHVTTTIGVTEFQTNDTFEQAFQRADNALLRGKRIGRNLVLSE